MSNVVPFPSNDNNGDSLDEILDKARFRLKAKVFCRDSIDALEIMKEVVPSDHEIAQSNADSLIEYFTECLRD